MADRTYEYEVTTDYSARDDDEIDIHIGDVIVVTQAELGNKKVTDERHVNAWVDGQNQTTNQHGQVPGTLLKLLPDKRPDVYEYEVDYTDFQPDQPLSGEPITSKRYEVDYTDFQPDQPLSGEPITSIRSHHTFEERYSKIPILCSLCNDYIWGTAINQCQHCGSTYHPGCAVKAGKCWSQADVQNVIDLRSERIPLECWSSEDLLKWLAAVNMSRYIDQLKKADVKELAYLSDAQLVERIDSFKITDKFHSEALTVLLKRLRDPDSVDLYLGYEPDVDVFKGDVLDHHLIEYNFPEMEKCDRCTQGLFGIFRQGWLCKGCGLVVHRQCAVGRLPECGKINYWEKNRNSLTRKTFVDDPYFGSSLENVQHSKKVNGVPALLYYCAKEMEQRQSHSRTQTVRFRYRASAGRHQQDITELKRKFDLEDESSEIDLTQYNDVVLPGVIKKYLKELSNPVVCSDLYQNFINLCQLGERESQLRELHKLIEQLPDIHRKTLEFLFKHFHTLGPTDEDVALVFSNILFRPDWQDIMLIADNAKQHQDLVKLIMKRYSPGQEVIESGRRDLKKCLWFWDKITREEEEEKMNGQPDGTFLVRRGRALSSEGEYYTISLRKGGSKVLIKIVEIHSENDQRRVGFTKDQLKFSSVPELIDHYRDQTLKNYNERLDVRLSNPIERKIQTSGMETKEIDKLKIRLRDRKDELKKLDDRLNGRNGELEKKSSELHQFNQAYDSFVHLITEFESQKEKSDKTMRTQSNNSFYKSLEQNSKKIESRLTKFKENKKKLEEKVDETENLKQKAITDIHSFKHSARKLQKEIDDIVSKLKANGVKDGEIEELLQNEDSSEDNGIYSTMRPGIPSESNHDQPRPLARRPTVPIPGKPKPPPAMPKPFILKRWDIDRYKAVDLVMNKPSGSYLLRTKNDSQCPFVLTVMNREPNHCKISQDRSGVGFEGCETKYSSIEELIQVYQHESLVKHNPNLDITLITQITEEDPHEAPYY